MKEIFYELIKEASVGKVIIDNDEWNISFNTKIPERGINYFNDNNFSTLVIKNEDNFFKLLEEYINLELQKNRKTIKIQSDIEKNKIKMLMSFLFTNATTEDFINPENLLRRNISFLKDTTFDYLEKGIEVETGINLKNSKLFIEKQTSDIRMETPNKINMRLRKVIDDKEVEYPLPSINYGIYNDTCYIYSIQMPHTSKELSTDEEKYYKQINRLLYKINNGIKENQDYYDYKEGNSTYYPEDNISDVTHSFVLSLSIFISLLERENIKKIKAVPYLPVRYASRYLAGINQEDDTKREKLLNRNNMIQTNITNKFIRTFRRLAYHNKSIEIDLYPYEFDEYLTLHLNDKETLLDNPILEEATNDIKNISK